MLLLPGEWVLLREKRVGFRPLRTLSLHDRQRDSNANDDHQLNCESRLARFHEK